MTLTYKRSSNIPDYYLRITCIRRTDSVVYPFVTKRDRSAATGFTHFAESHMQDDPSNDYEFVKPRT